MLFCPPRMISSLLWHNSSSVKHYIVMRGNEARSRLLEEVWHWDWEKKKNYKDDFPLFLPMQNHGPHEHRQVDQSRQGHGSDVANCGTHTSRLGRFAHLAKHDDLTRKKTKTKKCVCLTHLPHTICNKPRSGPPRVCLETV